MVGMNVVMLDALSEYNSVVTNMHRYMITIMGFICILLGTVAVWFLAKKRDQILRFIPITLIVFVFVQLFCSLFLYLTAQEWIMGIQLSLTALVGFYTALTMQKDWIQIYGIISLYNFLCVIGKLSFMGYAVSMYSALDSGAPIGDCLTWFGLTSVNEPGICYGYISFSRFLAFSFIFITVIQAFICCYIYLEDLDYSSRDLQDSRETERIVQKDSPKKKKKEKGSVYESIVKGNESD